MIDSGLSCINIINPDGILIHRFHRAPDCGSDRLFIRIAIIIIIIIIIIIGLIIGCWQ